MGVGINEVDIKKTDRGYWVVYINGDFYCTADSYMEAVKEVEKVSK